MKQKTKVYVISGAILLIFTVFLTAKNSKTKVKSLKTQKEKLNYTIGWDIGKNLKSQSIDVDPNILLMGIKDSVKGNKQKLTDTEMRVTMDAFRKKTQAKQMQESNKTAEKNKMEGIVFLAKNKTRKGVITLPSGLQYRVIKKGVVSNKV